MTREEKEARALALGVEFDEDTSDAALTRRINKAEAEVTEPERVDAKVLWANVWSSEGKHLKGEVYGFTAEDFALLDGKDAIKRV